MMRLTPTSLATRFAAPLALLALLSLARPAAAQQGGLASECVGAVVLAQDVCQKSADIFNLVAPQLGPGIAGGNAVFGGEGALGRTGAWSIGVRANFVRGRLPRLDGISLSGSGAESTDFSTAEPYVPIPTADVAVGLFGGVPLVGGIRLGALDALGSVSYVPDYDDANVSVRATDRSVQFGYGARLGLVQESTLIPGLAVTYLRRDLPRTELVGRVSATPGGPLDDTLGVSGLRTETQAWRVVASKRLAMLGIAVGGGEDRYSSRASLRGVLNEGPIHLETTGFEFRQSLTRTSYFADLSLHLPLLTLVAEVGQASGGSVPHSFNSFDGSFAAAEETVAFGAVGVRLKF
jgi:hypothetical protein